MLGYSHHFWWGLRQLLSWHDYWGYVLCWVSGGRQGLLPGLKLWLWNGNKPFISCEAFQTLSWHSLAVVPTNRGTLEVQLCAVESCRVLCPGVLDVQRKKPRCVRKGREQGSFYFSFTTEIFPQLKLRQLSVCVFQSYFPLSSIRSASSQTDCKAPWLLTKSRTVLCCYSNFQTANFSANKTYSCHAYICFG